MKLAELHTELLLKEIQTDGHSPLAFVCNGGDIYYCKYLPSLKREEINCLAYEVIAHFLLKKLEIPTPDIALVKATEGTLDKNIIKINKRLKKNNICFGSKEIPHATEIQSIAQIKNKTDFNKLFNPHDIIKIAIFDLWVNNVDRGRNFGDGFNYNLLLKPKGSKQQIIAFDNAFIFGGVDQIGMFNSKLNILSGNKLYQTPYYKSVVKHIDEAKYVEIIKKFIPLLSQNYGTLIKNIIQTLAPNWDLTPKLDDKIIAQLSDKDKIKEIKNVIIQARK